MAVEYRIDNNDIIVWKNEEWDVFLLDNCDHPHPKLFLGDSLYRSITGIEVQSLYQSLLKRVRGFGQVAKFPFRCDSPKFKRLMEMEIIPEAHRVLRFKTQIIDCVERPEYKIDENLKDALPTFTFCAWCNRVRQDSDWIELEIALQKLGLMTHPVLPPFTHGICPECKRDLLSDSHWKGNFVQTKFG